MLLLAPKFRLGRSGDVEVDDGSDTADDDDAADGLLGAVGLRIEADEVIEPRSSERTETVLATRGLSWPKSGLRTTVGVLSSHRLMLAS